MSSPISSVIANIFIEHFEKEALKKIFKKPEIWFLYKRYICDMETRQSHKFLKFHKFLIFLNNQHPNVHFTIEENGKFPFLDVLVFKKADGTLGHQVYRNTHVYQHT